MVESPEAVKMRKPRRRWHQFSLRAVLAAITLFGALLGAAGAYVAYEAAIVRERSAWLRSHDAWVASGPNLSSNGSMQLNYSSPKPFPSDSTLSSNGSADYIYPPEVRGDPERSPSAIRRWLGDTSVVSLHTTSSELKKSSEMFPEADLYVGHWPW